jgi:S-formylglutathione hydrolase FrmB
MAFLQISIASQVLGQTCAVNVILPQDRADDIPVLYLLHGLSDDHTAWMRETSIARYAAQRGVAIVMPSVNRGFYTDMAAGPAYWTYIADELPVICRRMFRITKKREKTFAAGLSMGGYGAFKLGLRKPEAFAAVASMSGAVDIARVADYMKRENPPLYAELERLVFGRELRPEDDLVTLAQSCKDPPKLWMCCGTEDFLIGANRHFHHRLTGFGLEHVYIESPGRNHTWDYWDEMIVQVLDWMGT